jgi:hypothetical protein
MQPMPKRSVTKVEQMKAVAGELVVMVGDSRDGANQQRCAEA